MAGGMPEARARTTKYLEALNRLSNGKLILYCVMGHVAHSPFLPSAVLEYLTVYPELTPVLKWTEDMQARLKRIKRGRAHPISLAGDGDYIDKVLNSRDDIALLYFYNRPDKIGNLNSRRGRITLNYVRKKQSEDWQHEQKIKIEDIGLVVFRGCTFNTHMEFENLGLPKINEALVDLALIPRWYFRELLRGTPVEDFLPDACYFGMGLSSPNQVHELIGQCNGNVPVAVLKPIMGHYGLGVRLLTGESIDDLLSQQQPVSKELLKQLIANSIFPITNADLAKDPNNRRWHPGFDFSDLTYDLFKGHFVENPEEQELLVVDDKELIDGVAGKILYPMFEACAGIVEKAIPSAAIFSRKTGNKHPGHIRALVIDGELIGAFYILTKRKYRGKVDFDTSSQRRVKTFMDRVEDTTEQELSDLLRRVVQEFEARLHSQIKSHSELLDYRNRLLHSLVDAS